MSGLVRFNFHGSDLEIARGAEPGELWVSIRRVCEALGLDEWSQQRKLKDKSWARTVMMTAPDQRGHAQPALMLHLDSLPMWLATIDVRRVAEDIRGKLELFQLECAKALRDHFLGGQRAATKDLDLRDRELKLRALEFAASAPGLADTSRQMLMLKAAQLVTGVDVTPLLPPAGHANWLSPTDIARRLGVSAAKVGRTITALGIRGEFDGIARPIINKAQGHNREVVSYVYSPAAVEQIEGALGRKAA